MSVPFNEEEFIFDEPEIALNEDLSNCVVVTGLPVVSGDKIAKLGTVLTKLFSKAMPKNIPEEAKFMPLNEKGATKGLYFIEFPDSASAARFKDKFDNLDFSGSKLRCVTLAELNRLQQTPDVAPTYTPPPYKARPELRNWFADVRAKEQFLIRIGPHMQLLAKDAVQPTTALVAKESWLREYEDRDVLWSPFGTYVLTFHSAGVALHGGPNMELLLRFAHRRSPDVPNLAAFSPNERFLVTWSNYPAERNDEPGRLIVWDIVTGLECMSIPDVPYGSWPYLQWSADDAYAAHINSTRDGIVIFETKTWTLYQGAAIPVERIAGFEWSPSRGNMLVHWVPEAGDVPARITLSTLEGGKLLKVQQKTLFKVDKVRFKWHPQGTFLAAIVERGGSSSSSTSSSNNPSGSSGSAADGPVSMEVFGLLAKGVPVETITLEMGDRIVDCGFEPYGDRLAVATLAAEGQQQRTTVRIYLLEEGQRVKVVQTFDKRPCNQILWSPRGRFLALAGTQRKEDSPKIQASGVEFIDAQEKYASTGHIEFMFCDTALWDPSGRFFALAVTFYNKQIENGYAIVNLRGRIVEQVKKDKFWQFSWRPRPPAQRYLSDKEVQKAKAAARDKAARYSKEDEALTQVHSAEEVAKRKAMEEEYAGWMKKWEERAMRYYSELRRNHVLREDDENDWVEVSGEPVETVLEEKEERIE
jgi:translation initiation factor 3 subunit B